MKNTKSRNQEALLSHLCFCFLDLRYSWICGTSCRNLGSTFPLLSHQNSMCSSKSNKYSVKCLLEACRMDGM